MGKVEAYLTLAQRMARYAQIRDAAASRGIDRTSYLLAGIAYAETGLAHCWSEATWACQGPNSADCGNGPVIAGAADGPCSAQQGGLGIFQFDAGTFTDTLNKYGADVLTVVGNTRHAINYVTATGWWTRMGCVMRGARVRGGTGGSGGGWPSMGGAQNAGAAGGLGPGAEYWRSAPPEEGCGCRLAGTGGARHGWLACLWIVALIRRRMAASE